MDYDYDILFIGGGLNYAGAVKAASYGMKTALVERDMKRLGGTCLHRGCIPSKIYLSAAERLLGTREELFAGEMELDISRLKRKKERVLADSLRAIKRQCAAVKLIEGEAILHAPHTVRVAGSDISARYIVIGTGASPLIPDGVKYDAQRVIVSDDIFEMESLPRRVTVYGSGAIALELLSFFAACSVECELILESQRVLESAHPEISSAMHEQLVELGVRLISGAEIVSACTQGERVKIEFSDASSHETPMLLLACGRVANIPKIEFDSIETDESGIVCDEYFESTLASHYAVGDCNGRAASAHAARAQVLNVVDRVAGRRVERIRQTDITNFIRTLPCSYASVGDIRSGFEKRGVDFREALTRLDGTPYSFMHAARNAMVVIYADEDSFISGAEIFAPGAEESIYSLSMALATETDARLAGRTIAAHPTFSEFVERSIKRLR